MRQIFKNLFSIFIMLCSIFISYYTLNLVFDNRFYIDENNFLYQFINISITKLFYNLITIFIPLLSSIIAGQVIIDSMSKLLKTDFTDLKKQVFHFQLVLITLQFIMMIFTENQFNNLLAIISCYVILDKYISKLTKQK